MKKIYTTLLALIFGTGIQAASYTIAISGNAYAPNTLTVSIGDVVTIEASSIHPLAQVDETTYNANGTATLSTGWGSTTANHTFTISNATTIYFVCQNHVGGGMKGMIVVNATGLNQLTNLVADLNIFPVPAKERINVRYELKNAANVSINLISLNGAYTKTLLAENQLAGTHQVSVNLTEGLTKGVYLLQLNLNGIQAKQQTIIVD